MVPVLLISSACFTLFIYCLYIFADRIRFYTAGQDSGFKFSEIALLWRLACECNIVEPESMFVSMNALNSAITSYIEKTIANRTNSNDDVQLFLTKLYNFRTSLKLLHESKIGLESSRYLERGQKIRIILPGSGVFTSEIVNNGYEIVVRIPIQDGLFKFTGKEWVGKDINVYLWRKGDAGYAFDTRVTNSGSFRGSNVIYLAQCNSLTRMQKRRFVRSECNIYARLFFLDKNNIDYSAIEEDGGYRCLLEDISESGALIRCGGKGTKNIQIKIQFYIADTLIIMFGIIRAVEYNSSYNQSRLHFECLHVDTPMRNIVLSYVYNTLPENKREEFVAVTETENEAQEDAEYVSMQQSEMEIVEPGIELPEIEASKKDLKNLTENLDVDMQKWPI